MKRKFLIALVIVCTMLTIFNVVMASEAVEYEEYYTYIENKNYISCEKYFSDDNLYSGGMEGIIYARLIDFDENGVLELVTVELGTMTDIDIKKVYYNVYTLNNGKMSLIGTGGIPDYDSIYAGFGFCQDSRGNHFFILVDENSNFEYYNYENGKWIENSATWDTRGTSVTIDGHYHYLSTIRETVYYLNGVEVDGERFDNYVTEKRTKGHETYNFRGTTYSNDGLSNWYKNTMPVPEWTTYGVLDKISTMYPGYFNPSNWSEADVKKSFDEGYVPTKLRREYTKSITREEFCEIATLFYEKYRGKIDVGNISFSDTTNESVLKMASLGIVSGVGNNLFAPNDSLTREMAATILVRLAKSMKMPLVTGAADFVDNDTISSWAYENVGISQKSGIMNGNADGTFAPNNNYTREQAIVTVYRLKNLFVPVQRLEIKENVSVIVDENCALPKVDFYPENATDLRITFKSENDKVFTCSSTEIQAVEEGTAKLIVTSYNGVETKTEVTVTPKVFITPKPGLNTSLNVIEDTIGIVFRKGLPNGFDDFPNGGTISSKIKVTNVKKLSRGNVEIDVLLSNVTTGYDDEYAEYNIPYLKWKLFDEKNRQIDEGLEIINKLKKVGDKETVHIDLGNLPKGNYTLEFISLEGREFDMKKEEPRIVVKGLPLKLSSVGLVDEGVPRDRSDDITETFTARLEDLEFYFEYSKSENVYYFSCNLIGSALNGSEWASQSISWTLTDSSGEELDDGTEKIYFHDKIVKEDMIEYYDGLEPGETYYITIKSIKNIKYVEGADYDCIIYED